MTIERRLERLERENRVWRAAMAICILILVMLGCAGWSLGRPLDASEGESVAKSIRTRSLVIVDREDKPVRVFESFASGFCRLSLGDEERSHSKITFQSIPASLPAGVECSSLLTPFVITSKKGRVGISSGHLELGIWDHTKKREWERVLNKLAKGTATIDKLDKRDEDILGQSTVFQSRHDGSD
jgi:hypothetical protein